MSVFFYCYLPRLFSLLIIALGLRTTYLSYYGLPEEFLAFFDPESVITIERLLSMGWLLIMLGLVMLLYKLNIIKPRCNQSAIEEITKQEVVLDD